jgi:hypothetical protein
MKVVLLRLKIDGYRLGIGVQKIDTVAKTPHSLYRCDECRAEVMISDQDLLKIKFEGWLTVNLHVQGGVAEEHHYCAECMIGVLKRSRG